MLVSKRARGNVWFVGIDKGGGTKYLEIVLYGWVSFELQRTGVLELETGVLATALSGVTPEKCCVSDMSDDPFTSTSVL